MVDRTGPGSHTRSNDGSAVDQRLAATFTSFAHIDQFGEEVERHRGFRLVGVPHPFIEHVPIIAEKVVPVEGDGEETFQPELVHRQPELSPGHASRPQRRPRCLLSLLLLLFINLKLV